MQVRHYNGAVRVDAFETPGFAPFYTPPTPAGFTRYEEYHPAFTYQRLLRINSDRRAGLKT